MQIGRGAGEKDERRRDEVRDPAREEDAIGRAACGDAGIDAYVIDGHEDHGDPAHKINGSDAGGETGSDGAVVGLTDNGWRCGHGASSRSCDAGATET
jgi:hypothetical protein